MAKNLQLLPGQSFPMGATVYSDGVNFCLYSQNIVNTENYDRITASRPGDNCAQALKGVVRDPLAAVDEYFAIWLKPCIQRELR